MNLRIKAWSGKRSITPLSYFFKLLPQTTIANDTYHTHIEQYLHPTIPQPCLTHTTHMHLTTHNAQSCTGPLLRGNVMFIIICEDVYLQIWRMCILYSSSFFFFLSFSVLVSLTFPCCLKLRISTISFEVPKGQQINTSEYVNEGAGLWRHARNDKICCLHIHRSVCAYVFVCVLTFACTFICL